MGIIENIDRIEQGKTSIISSIKSKGVNVPNDVLINEIAPYINEIQSGGGGDTPSEDIVPGGPHNPENDAFQEDFLWIENVDDTDGTITLNLEQAPFMYYSYDDDTEFQKMVSTNVLSIPAHSKIYLRWKGMLNTSTNNGGIISNSTSNCNHNIGGELKNGVLKSSVYGYLFYKDTKLIDASELKLTATTLTSNCYQYMFQGCTSLTTAPTLPATTLAGYCYYNMFSDCSNLTTAPALHATTLIENCYYYMFNNCTSLTTAPALPATTLANSCYKYMFSGCTSLTTAPTLPATTLAGYCYQSMFQGCTSLTTAPTLPATTLTNQCYSNMFSGCKNLNYVKTNVINWNTSYASNWLNNVAPSGIVEVLPNTTITENSTSGIPSGWTKQIDTSTKNTINIHNISGLENTISIPNKFSDFKYKKNNDAEYTENPKTTALTVTLQADETLIIEGIYYPSASTSSFNGITSTENINVYGEVNYTLPNMFVDLFNNSTKLIDASELKLTATTLASNCYQYMFQGCTSLTTAPALPATTLANQCYSNMFSDCTSLTTAPTLPATTLTDFCYQSMFYGCTSLTTAPTLPATTLTYYCYYSIFNGCRNLNSITFLSTEPFIYNDSQAKDKWLNSVSSKGTFRTPIENKEWIETYPRGASAVPSGWTIEYIEPSEPEEPEIEPDYTKYTDMLYFAPKNYTTNVQVKISEDCIVDEFKYTSSSLDTTDIKSLNYDELNYPTVSKGDTIEIDSLSGTSILWKGALRNNSSVDTPIFEVITDKEEDNEVQVQGQLNNGSFDYAYYYMFSGNTALSYIGTALVLTAEYVGRSAYQNMFFNCSNFTDGSEIHISAKVVKPYGLGAMFSGCTSLRTAPYLNVEQVDEWGMAYMFANTYLTTAPELKVTKLANDCFNNMFNGSTRLNYVKHHVVDWNESYATNWLIGVAPNGTVECPTNSTIPSNSVSGIPSGWTRVAIE